MLQKRAEGRVCTLCKQARGRTENAEAYIARNKQFVVYLYNYRVSSALVY
ncbi:MAG: hypothetical protein HXY43_15800 [Fischerella sp.]|nr:hypothetical protein [Fischerella sp.]NWF60676.1 hypothetical protein [Fischerella sp.]